jgi:hypothetical protein
MKRTIIFLFYIMFLLSCRTALCEIITVEFTGTVSSVYAGGDFTLDDSVNLNTFMYGRMTYDSTAVDQDTSPYCGTYDILTISMYIGNYTFLQQSPSYFRVVCGDSHYTFATSSYFDGTILVDGTPAGYEDLSWDDSYFSISLAPNPFLFKTDALPDADSFPPFSAFDMVHNFEVGFYRAPKGDHSKFIIDGEIKSLTVTPEPTSALLIIISAGLLRRKSRV